MCESVQQKLGHTSDLFPPLVSQSRENLFPPLVSQSRENLFPPLVSQSRENWSYKVLLELKTIIIWRQIGLDKLSIGTYSRVQKKIEKLVCM